VQALHPTMTKCIHAVKAKKILHWSNKQIKLSLAPTHAKVSGLAPTRRMCRDFIGNWNYEQCFPAGNQGRKLLKKLDKQRVDINYIKETSDKGLWHSLTGSTFLCWLMVGTIHHGPLPSIFLTPKTSVITGSCRSRTHASTNNFIKDFQPWTLWKHKPTRETSARMLCW
jgi:hypothetical protein